MLNLFAFFFAGNGAQIYLIAKIALAAIILICAAFIIFVVMKQSGNSDGMEAMTGKSSDDRDSYYGKNSSQSKEGKLKKWTFICAAALAVCAIAFLILTAVVK